MYSIWSRLVLSIFHCLTNIRLLHLAIQLHKISNILLLFPFFIFVFNEPFHNRETLQILWTRDVHVLRSFFGNNPKIFLGFVYFRKNTITMMHSSDFFVYRYINGFKECWFFIDYQKMLKEFSAWYKIGESL